VNEPGVIRVEALPIAEAHGVDRADALHHWTAHINRVKREFLERMRDVDARIPGPFQSGQFLLERVALIGGRVEQFVTQFQTGLFAGTFLQKWCQRATNSSTDQTQANRCDGVLRAHDPPLSWVMDSRRTISHTARGLQNPRAFTGSSNDSRGDVRFIGFEV
jgi:hypothetical protein